MTYFLAFFSFFFTILFLGKNQLMVSFVPEIDLYTFCQQNFITFKAHFSLVYYDSQCVPCKQEKEKKMKFPSCYINKGVLSWLKSRNAQRSLVLLGGKHGSKRKALGYGRKNINIHPI